jgi:single-strand DNA-binding protein
MARGWNKAMIIGHAGKDPTTAALPSGLVVTEFSLATTESWTDKQSGEKKEATEWHNVKLFGKVAEIAADFVRKGTLVYIEGKIKTRMWEKDGAKHYKTEIHADQLQLLSSREGGQDSGARGGYGGTTQNQAGLYQPAQQQQAPENFDQFDDDIPF